VPRNGRHWRPAPMAGRSPAIAGARSVHP